MAIAMVAMLAFGGTYAYFTATTTAQTKNVQTGKITLTTNNALTLVEGPVVPGQELLTQEISFTNTSTVESYVFVTFSAKVKASAEAAEAISVDVLDYDIDTAVWTELDKTNHPGVYYKKAATTDTSLVVTSSIKFVADNNYAEGSFDADNSTTTTDVEGKYIVVTVEAESIQTIDSTSGTAFASAAEAYTALQGAN